MYFYVTLCYHMFYLWLLNLMNYKALAGKKEKKLLQVMVIYHEINPGSALGASIWLTCYVMILVWIIDLWNCGLHCMWNWRYYLCFKLLFALWKRYLVGQSTCISDLVGWLHIFNSILFSKFIQQVTCHFFVQLSYFYWFSNLCFFSMWKNCCRSLNFEFLLGFIVHTNCTCIFILY